MHQEHIAKDPLPPGPARQFDIGDTDDSLAEICRYFEEYGDIFSVYAPGRRQHSFVISHPDDVKRVLVNNHRAYRKGVGINRVKLLLGNGIMVSEGDFWRRQRRLMQPHFHQRSLTAFYDNIVRCNQRLIDDWQRKVRQRGKLDITDGTSRVTLDIVLHAIFSDDLDRLADQVGANPFSVVSEETARDLRFAARFRALAKPIGALIHRRRTAGIQRHDLLGMLLASRDKVSGAGMDDRALIDEIMTFGVMMTPALVDEIMPLIVAGHETTASALNWLWTQVASRPTVAARLAQEVAAAGGGDGLCAGTILELPYLRQVIDETLRLYPPGWLITRRAVTRDRLAGYAVAPGANVLICPYVIHRHPRYWDDPERFDPERFHPDQARRRHRFVYLPFVAGPRHCIGDAFALTEMQIHVAMIVRNFELHYAPRLPIEIEAKVNLRTRHPVVMRARVR